MLSDGWHGGGGGGGQPTHDRRTTSAKSAEDVGQPAQHAYAHPLAQLIRRRTCKRIVSPMQKIAEAARGAPVHELEATGRYISAPWDARVHTIADASDGTRAAMQAQETQGIRVASSVSAKNQLVGIGGAIKGILGKQ